MNDLRSPRGPYLSDEHLEDMLRTFFRSEVPEPWPALKAPEAPARIRKLAPPWWKPATGRFALAASIGLILVGYLALARGFPRSNPPAASGLQQVTPDIGALPGHVHPKNLLRRPVVIEETKGKDGRFFLKAQFLGEPKDNR